MWATRGTPPYAMKRTPSLLTDGVRAEFPLRLLCSPGRDQVIDRSSMPLRVHFNNPTDASVGEFWRLYDCLSTTPSPDLLKTLLSFGGDLDVGGAVSILSK